MFTLYKVSLLRNDTSVLLLSKSKINLKFRASTRIAWSCMKLRLFHNLKLLWYTVVRTSRCIQEWWSSWKSTREGRMNLKLLKYLFVYVFTLSVCKICILQSEKTEERCTHAPLHLPSLCTCTLLGWSSSPLPAWVLYGWSLRLNTFL